ncbi:hypothetical protein HER39_08730, partial [Arthrobacter deserti]|nr:hypothetical protein [Arthrobacter deserti]
MNTTAGAPGSPAGTGRGRRAPATLVPAPHRGPDRRAEECKVQDAAEALAGKDAAGNGLLRFHHVAIIASDYARSKAFYTELLGFGIRNETYREERGSYKLDLELPRGDTIELFSFPSPPARRPGPEPVGLRHLAFAVRRIEPVAERLQRAGVAVEPVR